jgi:hypothetical protein
MKLRILRTIKTLHHRNRPHQHVNVCMHAASDETAYQVAAYTRALRKVRLARQRRQHMNHARPAALEDYCQPLRACKQSRTRSAGAINCGRLQQGLDPNLAAGDRQVRSQSAHVMSCLYRRRVTKGRFTLWPSKSRGRAIEWPNFVESPKK